MYKGELIMDTLKDVRSIGLFETSKNLVKVLSCEEVYNKVGAVMPLPYDSIEQNMKDIAIWIHNFHKKNIMFLTPEIALIDELLKLSNDTQFIIALPNFIDEETKETILNNNPDTKRVFFLQDFLSPSKFQPYNSLLITCGFITGDHYMVLPETFSLNEKHNNFLGKKLFIPYTEFSEPVRYDDWVEIKNDKFNQVWRMKQNE
jgi:hypothetical protein